MEINMPIFHTRYMDRGSACIHCLVNGGGVSPEECIGCSGEIPCNYDYYPTIYNKDGSLKNNNKYKDEL